MFESTSPTRLRAEGGSTLEKLGWGEGPQRVDGRGRGVCPQRGLPELGPARHQGERWAGARRTGIGGESEAERGP